MDILYTHQLNGNLAYLPRLFTHIKQISTQLTHKPLLLDLGGACAPTEWHCEVTEGRSALIVLDAMGYHAVTITDTLTSASYDKLKDQVAMALVDETSTPIVMGALLSCSPRLIPDAPMLKICLTPADKTGVVDDWLYLSAIASDEIGIVQFDEGIIQHRIEKIPTKTPPNATISGVVDFVLAEARYYQSKK
ncbi:MAG: hypothetical protein SFZ02_01160 [bacterium]|nr:hypothetical protein [bacterium]